MRGLSALDGLAPGSEDVEGVPAALYDSTFSLQKDVLYYKIREYAAACRANKMEETAMAVLDYLTDISMAKVEGVFFTHIHYDHIYGICRLLELYPECLVYTSSFGKEALASDRKNFSRYHGDPIVLNSDNMKILRNGDRVKLFQDTMIEIFETLGHDKSCLTYKIGNNLFTGDSYIPGVKVITSFPNSNKEDAELSKQKILSISQSLNLFPGHGNSYMDFRLVEW